MITNGEVTINRRRRVGDFEHNDVTVKLSFTMDGITKEEEFRCNVMDQAVKLAMLGLSTPNAACAADTTSPVPAPEKTAASRQRQPRQEPQTISIVGTDTSNAVVGSPSPAPEAPAIVIGGPPTQPAAVAAPIAAPPAPSIVAPNAAIASPAPPINGLASAPMMPGSPPNPPTVPAPVAVASPSDAAATATAGGESSKYADNTEFQKALVAQVTRINGLRPGRGGLEVNLVTARYVQPPKGAGAIPVEQREAFVAEVEAIQ